MARCRVDKSIERVQIDGFDFPLGVYPVEECHPVEGYTTSFEPADNGPPQSFSTLSPDADEDDSPTEGQWEHWPDRYVWDVVVRHSRLEAFTRALFAILPGRFYPILDVLGNDAYREADPYVAYELVGQERFAEGIRRFRGFLYEDGLVGFGAMADEPFYYVFIDEHKIVTIRAEAALKDRVESVLDAFNLKPVEQLRGADSVTHEHRSVLDAPPDRPDLLTPDEIVEELRDLWSLELSIDGDSNLDDAGNPLGVTGWRCLIRMIEQDGRVRYIESFLTAANYNTARQLAFEAAQELHEARLRSSSDPPVPPSRPGTPSDSESSPERGSGPPGSATAPEGQAGPGTADPPRTAPRSSMTGRPKRSHQGRTTRAPGQGGLADKGHERPGEAGPESHRDDTGDEPHQVTHGGDDGGFAMDDADPDDPDADIENEEYADLGDLENDELDSDDPVTVDIIACDRLSPEDLAEQVPDGKGRIRPSDDRVLHTRWVDEVTPE
jgi:hypothetical protein